jgi:hypothetical protein
VSASRDNLPAVSDLPRARTGEHPAVPELRPIEENTRKTLGDVRWLLAISLGGIAAIVVATSATIAFAQDAGVKAIAPIEKHLDATDARVAALEKGQADMQRMTVETNATLRLVAMRLGVTPVTLEQPKDGGP